MSRTWLRTVRGEELPLGARRAYTPETLREAEAIVEDVQAGGESAVRRIAARFGEIEAGQDLFAERAEMARALDSVAVEDRRVLERAAGRIEAFARAQRASVSDVDVGVPGGRAGHMIEALERAGCYAPGGRYPLPSSVLMTAVTARAAGVRDVCVASPRPGAVVLAAAAIAGADRVLRIGGAHAIAAMAFGLPGLPARDIIVGPGNRWVTAAKYLVSDRCAIDMLAGPSELVVLADESADAGIVAADLIAQAEHDPDALPVLVTTSQRLIDSVNRELGSQLAELPTRQVAEASLANGFATVVASMEEGIAVCNGLAPEHLEVMARDEGAVVGRLRGYGGLFIGRAAAEVFGDYGIGPNHTLPTGGTARHSAGLSVMTFLRARTWLRMDDADAVVGETARLARMEGLEGHARAAERRLV